jgi:NAD(P) transhydrogenase
LIGEKGYYNIDLNDEVVRGSIILKDGQMMWPPPPPPAPTPQQVAAAAPAAAAPAAKVEPPNPFTTTFKDALMYSTGKLQCQQLQQCD